MDDTVALVLSGGGTRGAYEAGVVQGIVEVLGRRPADPAPFQVFTGTSVGALNASFLASHAHRGDLDVNGLAALWASLTPGELGRVGLGAWARRGLLDVAPLERLVRAGLDQEALDRHVAEGVVRALVVAALHVGTGRTAIFSYVAPGVPFRPSQDPRRATVLTRVTADHVLASAAIPGLFPPRPVEGRLFYDGGLRFNTPIAPAIRAGASRLVVVSPLHVPPAPPPPTGTLADLGQDLVGGMPDVRFLAGKMLNAILADPVVYDLQVLDRINQILAMLDATLTPEERARLDEATTALRGQPWRRLDTLVFSPSEDLGHLGAEHLRRHRRGYLRVGPFGWLLASMATDADHPESDLASYLLFDGRFAEVLLDLGRRDAHARADEVRAFFGDREAARQAG